MKPGDLQNNDQQAQRVAYLITGYIRKTLTESEHDELDRWIEASDENMLLFEELTDERNLAENLALMQGLQTETALDRTKESIGFPPNKTRKTTPSFWPYLAAASVIIIIIGVYLFMNSRKTGKTNEHQNEMAQTDVKPGGNRAILTLSDGHTIDLNESETGVLKTDAANEVSKTKDGELSYSSSTTTSQTVAFHTLTTPKGGQYMLTLADGSKVWLNAASSLYFPTQFTGNERKVQLITGEAYFEVSKDASHPFIVEMPDEHKVKVLGTHFVTSGYANESSHEVTLEEGSVEVTNSAGKLLRLEPGQQAVIANSVMSLNKNVDMEAALGFTQGNFVFNNANIQSIMRQVERWYDVNIVYRTSTSEHFNATISRNVNVSNLLHLLELTGKIHFTIQNKTIYVLP